MTEGNLIEKSSLFHLQAGFYFIDLPKQIQESKKSFAYLVIKDKLTGKRNRYVSYQ